MAVDQFRMPFLNGQIAQADPTPVAAPASLMQNTAAIPTNPFIAQIADASKLPPAPKSIPYIAQLNPANPVIPVTTPTGAPAAPAGPSLPSVPVMPNYDDFVTGKSGPSAGQRITALTGSGGGLGTVFAGDSNNFNDDAWHKARAGYLSVRDDRLNKILSAVDPGTAAQVRDDFHQQLAALQNGQGVNAAGKTVAWHDLDRTDQLANISKLYDSVEATYKPDFFQSAA